MEEVREVIKVMYPDVNPILLNLLKMNFSLLLYFDNYGTWNFVRINREKVLQNLIKWVQNLKKHMSKILGIKLNQQLGILAVQEVQFVQDNEGLIVIKGNVGSGKVPLVLPLPLVLLRALRGRFRWI